MKLLSIDTSTKQLAIGMSDDTGVRFAQTLVCNDRHLEKLFVLIEEGRKALGWNDKSFDYLACGLGPGSFTGLRIGLGAIKGLSAARKTCVIGFSSLDAIAHSVVAGSRILSIVDARRGTVYAAWYEIKKGCIVKKGADALMTIEQVSARLKQSSQQYVVTGDALKVYGELLRVHCGKTITCASEAYWYPTGAACIALAETAIQQRVFLTEAQLVPQYLRDTSFALHGAKKKKKKTL